MITDYNARLLSSEIKTYFEANKQAVEVLIFKGLRRLAKKNYHRIRFSFISLDFSFNDKKTRK